MVTGKLDDFLTEGEIVLAWAGANSTVVIDEANRNIVFDPGPRFAGNLTGGVDPKTRADRNYDLLLDQATTAPGTQNLFFPDLAVGQRYKVQLWLADTRTSSANRLKTYDSGPDTPQVKLNTGTPSAHFVIGTFVADAETQLLRCVAGAGSAEQPQYNAIVLRAVDNPAPVIRAYTATLGGLSSDKGLLVPAGQEVSLSWELEKTTEATLTGSGAITPKGSKTLIVNQETTLTLNASNAEGASSKSITLFVGASPKAPRLSEVLARTDRKSLEDEDDERQDWIEIENPNPFALDLSGYALTDDPSQPKKWLFPSGAALPASGHLIVFASGKNRAVAGQPLHTGFKLDGSKPGETILLVGSTGVELSKLGPLPEQWEGLSWGIGNEGTAGFMDKPSPGAANGASFAGKVADTVFSKKRGYYDAAFELTISSGTADAQILYTTNGSAPTPSTATAYAGPISISGNTVIRAAAFKQGWIPTNVDTHTYIFLDQVIKASVMKTSVTNHATYGPQMKDALKDLPSFSLVGPTKVDYPEAPASVEMLNPDGTTIFQENCGLGLFGGYWTNFTKKSFRLYFRGKYGTPELRVPGLFKGFERGRAPAETYDCLDLRNGSHDMVERGFYMSCLYTDDTMLDLGNLAPHGRWVHVYLNGAYWGVYHLRERWHAAMVSNYLGGSKDEYSAINGNANVGGWAIGANHDGTNKTWVTIKNLRRDYDALRKWLDISNYIDFNLVYMSGDAENEYRCSGPDRMGPGYKFWFNDADGFLRAFTDKTSDAGPGTILSALRSQAHPDFKVLLADRIHKTFFGDGELAPARAVARLDERAKQLERPFLAEAARWGFRTPDNWRSAKDNALKALLPKIGPANLPRLRTKGLYPATAAPVFAPAPGQVEANTVCTIRAATGELFYTLDGTDPRLPGGAVSPAAKMGQLVDSTMSASVAIPDNTWIRARAKNGNEWSAIEEGFYHLGKPVSAGEVLISELHYNPKGSEESEFLELWNPTAKAINLRGCRFSTGINYLFPANRDTVLAPGARLVLCQSQLGFSDRYGVDSPWQRSYFGSLNNDDEKLTLVASDGTTNLLSQEYADRSPWPESADDQGFSLVLKNASAPANPASWAASTALGGSPGQDEGATGFTGNPTADADGDGLPALVEFLFGGSDLAPNSNPMRLALDGNFAELSFPRASGTESVKVRLESSTDLRAWSSDAFALTESKATEKWRSKAPLAAGGSLFVRLVATQ